MKSTMKFALSLLIGSSVLTLTACDNQETKTPEKVTALSENKTEAMPETTQVSRDSKEETVSSTDKNEEAKNSVAVEKVESKALKEVKNTVVESTIVPNVEKQKQETVEKAVRQVKPRKTATNSYLKEQKALLKVLESQYQQIRCTAEAAKLGENSFCRQEERRLLSEIERVKKEIRLNR